MTNETLQKKMVEVYNLNAEVKKLNDAMDKLKGEILAELDERKIETFEYPSQKLTACVVNKTRRDLDKTKLAVHFKGEIPDEYYKKPTISHYVQVKVV